MNIVDEQWVAQVERADSIFQTFPIGTVSGELIKWTFSNSKVWHFTFKV